MNKYSKHWNKKWEEVDKKERKIDEKDLKKKIDSGKASQTWCD
ncbi:hypothetical protein [Mucilaginibacter aurantiaciroseus]|nr:hypothetical protein [Mucilaginibacter aurantiaciroseus]